MSSHLTVGAPGLIREHHASCQNLDPRSESLKENADWTEDVNGRGAAQYVLCEVAVGWNMDDGMLGERAVRLTVAKAPGNACKCEI